MQLTGMNALFGLQVHITVGERMIVAVAVSNDDNNNNNESIYIHPLFWFLLAVYIQLFIVLISLRLCDNCCTVYGPTALLLGLSLYFTKLYSVMAPGDSVQRRWNKVVKRIVMVVKVKMYTNTRIHIYK